MLGKLGLPGNLRRTPGRGSGSGLQDFHGSAAPAGQPDLAPFAPFSGLAISAKADTGELHSPTEINFLPLVNFPKEIG